MANEEEEEKLDLTSRLVKNYQKANVALLERVSIMKEAYKEAAKENELVKQVLQNAQAASKNKKLSRDLQREATEGDVLAKEIEAERLKLEEKRTQLAADRVLAEQAAEKAKKDGLKEETELYQDIVKEIEEATAQLGKMNDAAKGVSDKASEIESKSGSSFFQGLKDILPSGFTDSLDDIGSAFKEGAKEAKKVRMETDKANQAAAELDKIEEVKFKRGGKDQSRFRFKKGQDPGGIKGGQRFISGDKVKGLQKTAKGAKGAAGGFLKAFGAGIKKVGKMLFSTLKKAMGPLGLITEFIQAIGQVDQEVTELGKSLTLSRKEAEMQRSAFANTAAMSGDIFVTTEKLIKSNTTLNKQLGTAVAFNSEILVTSTQLAEKVKLQGEEMAGLAAQTIVTGGSMRDNYETSLETSYAIQQQTGVAVDLREVLIAVGKTTGQIRAQLGGSTEAITKAVTTAKTLGMELSKVAAAGKTLLSFEESISSELEAELLTGKQLNLERARLAALTGDYETLTKEIAANAGDFTEFSKMNVLQQDALAKSLGMQSDELADILFKQEVQGKTARELRDMGKDELAAQLERTTAQDKFNASMDKLKSLLADIVTPILPLLDLLGSLFSLIGPIVKFLNPLIQALRVVISSVVDYIESGGLFGILRGKGNFDRTASAFEGYKSSFSGGEEKGPAASMNDGTISSEGLVVKSPKGSIQLNKDDSAIVGTNLGGGGNNTSNNMEIDYDKMARANAAAMANVTVETRFDDFKSRSVTAQSGINNNRVKQVAPFA